MARAAHNAGSISKVTRKSKNGKEYVYWVARISTVDESTGKQKQISFSAKTQREARLKMQDALNQISDGTFVQPHKMTVAQWLDEWEANFLINLKPNTRQIYRIAIEQHIKPAIGGIKLQKLTAEQCQHFINEMHSQNPHVSTLSPKTVQNHFAVLHSALEKAVQIGLIRFNPASNCELPKIVKKQITPLTDEAVKIFLESISGHRYEQLFKVALFTGMRTGEVLGLEWSCINFKTNEIVIRQQLQEDRATKELVIVTTKNSKTRNIVVAQTVIDILKQVKAEQFSKRCKAQQCWNNQYNLVFTNEIGEPITAKSYANSFKRQMIKIGMPDVRPHDLRHSYAVISLQNGTDFKTLQNNLGHSSASFTLDVYGHISDTMRKESANQMEKFIQSVS